MSREVADEDALLVSATSATRLLDLDPFPVVIRRTFDQSFSERAHVPVGDVTQFDGVLSLRHEIELRRVRTREELPYFGMDDFVEREEEGRGRRMRFEERRIELHEERERVSAQLKELGHGDDASLSFDDGFADSSQVTAERGEIDALAGRLEETLREIDEALAKIEDGTYGRCESCGKEIGAARLEAMPSATLCITCASKSR